MLELRLRSCHIHGKFTAKDNVRPKFTLADAINNPRQDAARVVLPPASFAHEQEKVNVRWPAAVKFIKENKLNEVINDGAEDFGIICKVAFTTRSFARYNFSVSLMSMEIARFRSISSM